MTTTSDTPRDSRRCHHHTLSGIGQTSRTVGHVSPEQIQAGLAAGSEAAHNCRRGGGRVGFVSRAFKGRPRDQPRDARVPPGQYVVHDFPVLSAGPTPHTPLAEWSFSIEGEVDEEKHWTWEELRALPSETVTRDIHCVTKWSKLDTTWEGVSVDTLLEGSRDGGGIRDGVLRWRLHHQPPARGRHRRQGLDRIRIRRATAREPSMAARPGCWCRTCTSGRAPSGSAGCDS